MDKLIYCHDGCLAPMIAKQNAYATWEIYGISKVYGMGSGEYKRKLFDFVLSEIIVLNSFKGIAYVCLKRDLKWGLLEVKANNTIECDWKMISDFSYATFEEVLSDFNINKFDFES